MQQLFLQLLRKYNNRSPIQVFNTWQIAYFYANFFLGFTVTLFLNLRQKNMKNLILPEAFETIGYSFGHIVSLFILPILLILGIYEIYVLRKQKGRKHLYYNKRN